MSRVDCPLCGDQPSRPWRREAGHTVVACSSCGLRITWPRPTAEELARVYAQADYYARHAMASDDPAAWDERLAALLARVPAPIEHVLDFGAGEGHGVAALRRLGYAAEGLEPSSAGRLGARAQHGIELRAGFDELGPARFDLVLALHSLEHVPGPIAALRTLAASLRPGGWLLIEVPHAGSADLWLARERGRILSLPAHLYHFTPTTLTRIVECAGLAVFDVTLSNPLLLERAFAWRASRQARARPRATCAPVGASAAGAGPPLPGRAGLRGLWARRLLPALRRRLPGYKFQLLARRLDGPPASMTR